MSIYRFKVKLHANKGYITMFYDEDRETVIKEMGDYNKKNGFTYYEGKYRFTCADLVITEEMPTGEILSETPYIKLFDTFSGRRLA